MRMFSTHKSSLHESAGPVAHDRLPQLDSVYLSLSRPSLGQSRIHLVPVCVPTSCVNGDNSRRMKHEEVGIALEALEQLCTVSGLTFSFHSPLYAP